MEGTAAVSTERFSLAVSQDNLTVTGLVNARMQRLQELEKLRQEHEAAHTPGADNSESRHSRRERYIRQTTQQRSTERRSFLTDVQRTPARSQSFENSGSTVNVNEDTLSFRERFESSRQNIFGQRAMSGSTEDLVTASTYGRRPSDTPGSGPRLTFQTTPDSNSGSSTPSISRGIGGFAAGLAQAFSSMRRTAMGTESGRVSEMRRSASITRDTRSSSSEIQRLAISNAAGSTLTRSGSVRESRRESRYRRRTIDTADTNITQALQQERTRTASPSANRPVSPLVLQSSSSSSSTVTASLSETTSVRQSRGMTHAASFSSFSSTYGSRTFDIYADDREPVLGTENEKVVFVDTHGRCHWLNKNHPLLRKVGSASKFPEVVIKPPLRSVSTEAADGYIASLEGDSDNIYGKMRALVFLARKRDASLENEDCPDSVRSLSLLELYQRGDYSLEAEEDIDIDDRYKSVSLYTPPRPRPNIESLVSKKEVPSLYDGIPESELPAEIREKEEANSEGNQSSSTGTGGSYTQRSSHSVSQSSSTINESSGVSGTATSASFESQQESVTSQRHVNGVGIENSNYQRSSSSGRLSEMRMFDGGNSFLQRQAEARQQHYMAERQVNENGTVTTQRQAGERHQESIAEEHVSENGWATSRSRVERSQRTFVSETTGAGRTRFQRANERFGHQFYSENRDMPREQTEERTEFSESADNRLETHEEIDNSDLHGEVNLVMQRLQMMQENADQPIDTSHLDYEEMKMIQKALEENPSPPESPVDFESRPIEFEPSDFSSELSITIPEENVGTVSETSNTTFTDINAVNDIVETIETVPEQRSSTFNVTNVTSPLEGTSQEITTKNESSIVSTHQKSDTNFFSAKESVITHTSNVSSFTEENVVEARTPRYQRLPSEGSEGRLPLPSMDWSPLERTNSPLSPTRFSFEDRASESVSKVRRNLSSSSLESGPILNKPSVAKITKLSSQNGSQTSVQSELSIEIPNDSPGTSQILANRRDSYKSETESIKSSASPLVKSLNTSRSGSEAPSPAGSEGINTVFEEFVQTVPMSLIRQWQAESPDKT